MKKILYLITQSELGGAQKYVLDLATALQDDFAIIVAFGEQGAEGDLAKKLKSAKAVYYTIPHLKRRISPLNDLLAAWEIAQLIKRIKPDIIHLNSTKISILGSLAAKILHIFAIRNIRVIYTVHGWVFNEPLPGSLKLFYKFAEKFTAGAKDKIICVSAYDRQTARKEKIAPLEKFVTIHNGLARPEFLSPVAARQRLSDRINVPLAENTRLIGSIGNLYPTKGYEYLLAAAARLAEKDQSLCFVIIGEGPARPELEKIIKAKKLEKIVCLTGRIADAPSLLPAFDLYVCSSVKEGLSYTVMEAMAAGRPIVATAVGGNPELIADGETGDLAPARDGQCLAEKIAYALAHPDRTKTLAARAREKISTEFSLDTMIKKTREIYEEKSA